MRKLFLLTLVLFVVGCYNAPPPPQQPTSRIEIEIQRPVRPGPIVVPPAPPPIIVQPPSPPIIVPPPRGRLDIRIEGKDGHHRSGVGVDIDIHKAAEKADAEKTAQPEKK